MPGTELSRARTELFESFALLWSSRLQAASVLTPARNGRLVRYACEGIRLLRSAQTLHTLHVTRATLEGFQFLLLRFVRVSRKVSPDPAFSCCLAYVVAIDNLTVWAATRPPPAKKTSLKEGNCHWNLGPQCNSFPHVFCRVGPPLSLLTGEWYFWGTIFSFPRFNECHRLCGRSSGRGSSCL